MKWNRLFLQNLVIIHIRQVISPVFEIFEAITIWNYNKYNFRPSFITIDWFFRDVNNSVFMSMTSSSKVHFWKFLFWKKAIMMPSAFAVNIIVTQLLSYIFQVAIVLKLAGFKVLVCCIKQTLWPLPPWISKEPAWHKFKRI